MKKIILLVMLIFLVACSNSSNKKNEDKIKNNSEIIENNIEDNKEIDSAEDSNDNAIISKIILTVDKTKVLADGKDKIVPKLVIYDIDEKEIKKNNYMLYINNEISDLKDFKTLNKGIYEIKVLIDEIYSNSIEVEAYDAVKTIKLSSNLDKIVADGVNIAKLEIEFQNQNDEIMNDVEYSLYCNDDKMETTDFSTLIKGEYKFKVKVDSIESNEIKIEGYDIVKKVEISLIKTKILANNVDFTRIKINIINQNDIIIKDKLAKIYINGENVKEEVFKTDTPGEYEIYAKFNNIESNRLTIDALQVDPLIFEGLSPYYNQTQVDINTTVVVKLNKTLEEPIVENAILLNDINGKNIKGKIIYKSGEKKLTFELIDKLEYGKTYEVIINKDLIGIEKNVLSTIPKWIFTVQNFPEFTMKKIEKGEFIMGDEQGDLWEICRPIHKVTLDYNYEIGETEITFKEYDAYCKAERITKLPSDNRWGRGENPVINVSWFDAIKYCNWLSKLHNLPVAYNVKTGKFLDENGNLTNNIKKVKGYRLLTEAEWEFAARGGNRSRNSKYSGHSQENLIAWYVENSSSKIHLVKQKHPNELGIYDMSGNVWEWCHDGFEKYSKEPKINPVVEETEYKIMRGGSWYSINYDLRISHREYFNPNTKDIYFGFRIARTLEE